MRFNEIFAKTYGAYTGSRYGISYKITKNNGEIIEASNWRWNDDGMVEIIPYVRIEREIKSSRKRK